LEERKQKRKCQVFEREKKSWVEVRDRNSINEDKCGEDETSL
jgi:hypothetical protein